MALHITAPWYLSLLLCSCLFESKSSGELISLDFCDPNCITNSLPSPERAAMCEQKGRTPGTQEFASSSALIMRGMGQQSQYNVRAFHRWGWSGVLQGGKFDSISSFAKFIGMLAHSETCFLTQRDNIPGCTANLPVHAYLFFNNYIKTLIKHNNTLLILQ